MSRGFAYLDRRHGFRSAPALPDAGGVALIGRLVWLPLALVIGVLVAAAPTVGISAGLLLAAALALWAVWDRLSTVFLGALGVLLTGYAFFGRGLAHLGANPFYVGELVLVLAIVALIASLGRARFGTLHALLVAFMAWCAFRTIPYLGTYGLDALRDGVTWGYALFAIALSVAVRRRHLAVMVSWYRRLIPFFLTWVPIAAVLWYGFVDRLPLVPGSDVPLVVFKGGDFGVHLTGIAAFVIVGLYSQPGARTWLAETLVWPLWFLCFAIVGAFNRGGLVSVAAVAGVFAFVGSASRFLRMMFIGLLLVVAVAIVDPTVSIGGSRQLSFGQLVDNVASIVSSTGGDNSLQGTKDYRLRWWGTIVGYTVDGPYFWTGKGFGVNLADEDGFQIDEDRSLRAPHNGHFEILARAGVPGLALWLVFVIALAGSLLRAGRRMLKDGRPMEAGILGWFFVYLTGALINMSFDPSLQGPHGGIWFWSLVGLSMAALAIFQESAVPRPAGRSALVGGAAAR